MNDDTAPPADTLLDPAVQLDLIRYTAACDCAGCTTPNRYARVPAHMQRPPRSEA